MKRCATIEGQRARHAACPITYDVECSGRAGRRYVGVGKEVTQALPGICLANLYTQPEATNPSISMEVQSNRHVPAVGQIDHFPGTQSFRESLPFLSLHPHHSLAKTIHPTSVLISSMCPNDQVIYKFLDIG